MADKNSCRDSNHSCYIDCTADDEIRLFQFCIVDDGADVENEDVLPYRLGSSEHLIDLEGACHTLGLTMNAPTQ